MKTRTIYRVEERQTIIHSWGTTSETLFGGEEEKYLGFGNLVQITRVTFHPGYSGTPMTLYRNRELIDIVLRGQAGYQDGFGKTTSSPQNTVHVVSSGTGVYRSDYNASSDEVLEKLQIGILPKRLNDKPVQTKALFDLARYQNSFVTLVSPYVDTSSLSVRQQAALLLGQFSSGEQIIYDVSGSTTGLFLFVVEGMITVGDQILNKNEAIAFKTPERIGVTFAADSVLLLMELEMPQEENV